MKSLCNYKFSSKIAPTIFSVLPTIVSGDEIITIYGEQFGYSAAKLSVTIGSQTCAIVSVNDTTVICTLSGLNIGIQNINVYLEGTLIQ